MGKMLKKVLNKASLNPALVLTLGFLVLISVGGILLHQGFATNSGEKTRLIDSFFVAASASCVTGLSPVNTLEHWNIIGQLIIITLIQIGGLGVMSLATLIALIFRKKIGHRSRKIIKESLNVDTMEGMIKLFKYVLIFTLVVELIGAVLLSIRFIPEFGLVKGIHYSLFHSISSYCNAGFDILGDSLYPYRADALVNITIMFLVISGGLGFMVTSELFEGKRFRDLSNHSKVVIVTTIILLIGGALGFFILENFDGGVLENESIKDSIIISFFQSTSARTAGFYSVDLSKIKDSTALLLMGLMFIGGSPGSTAGGIKTTTIAVLALSTISLIKNEREPIVFKKHLGSETIKKALAIFSISLFMLILVTFIISITDKFALIDILYEVTSALATVGASKGITAHLSIIAKVLIGFCMFLGRVGPMTMAFAFGLENKNNLIRYPEMYIGIG